MKKLIFTLCITFLSFNLASADLSGLKSYLNGRNAKARMYLPESVPVSQEAKVVVVANGAKSVQLLGSVDGRGIEGFDNELKLRLGKQYHDWGTKEFKDGENQVAFSVPFKDPELANKPYFFEALVTYPGEYLERIETALSFGPNANFIGYNAIRVAPAPESSGGASTSYNFANTLFPGLGQQNY